ncbi:hypothetical protein BDF19DRAFT_446013, partial [Syncephalis fuscata]
MQIMQRGNGSFIKRLPPEIHVHIARFLTTRELLAMCRVTRQFAPRLNGTVRSPYDPDRPARIVKHIALLLREFGETPLHYQANAVIAPVIQHKDFLYENMAIYAGKSTVPVSLIYWWAWQSGSPDLIAALLRARWQLTAECLRHIEWDYQPRDPNLQSNVAPPFHGNDQEGILLREAMASVGSEPDFFHISPAKIASIQQQRWRRSASYSRQHVHRDTANATPRRATTLFIPSSNTTTTALNYQNNPLLNSDNSQYSAGWLQEAFRLRRQFWSSCFTPDAPQLISAVLRDPWACLIPFPPVDAIEMSRSELRSLISEPQLSQLLALLEERSHWSLSHAIFDWLLMVAVVCRSHTAMVRIRRMKRCTSRGWNQALLRLTCYAVLAITNTDFLPQSQHSQQHSMIVRRNELQKLTQLYREVILNGLCTRRGIDRALITLYVDRIDYDATTSAITVQNIPGSGDALTGGRARVDSVHLMEFGELLLSTRLYSDDPAGRLLRHCCQRPDRSGMMITGTNNNADTADVYYDMMNTIGGSGSGSSHTHTHTHMNGQDLTINTSGTNMTHPVPQLLHFIIDGGRYPPEDADWCLQWLLRAGDLALLRRVLRNGIYSSQGLSWCFQHAHRFDDVTIYTEILQSARPDNETLQRWRGHTGGRPKRKVARLLQEPDGGLRKLAPHLAENTKQIKRIQEERQQQLLLQRQQQQQQQQQ